MEVFWARPGKRRWEWFIFLGGVWGGGLRDSCGRNRGFEKLEQRAEWY